MTTAVNAGARGGIVLERSEAALLDAIEEYCNTTGRYPEVIITPLPIISETYPDLNVEKVHGIPVAVCPLITGGRIYVADTQAFCDLRQAEKEEGFLNEH